MPDCIVLIPAYQPDHRFPVFAEELRRRRLTVLVVDDGSGDTYRETFSGVRALGIPVVTHETNRGKGAAIRTGIREIMTRYPDAAGIVTADCDGQHSADDIETIIAQMEQNPGSLILGSRDLKHGVPFRSAIGNTLIRRIFRGVTGIPLSDTQSGLRGLPACLFPSLLRLPGDRYEYEMNLLLRLKELAVPYLETPIRTIYFGRNAGSHYRTYSDSWRILKLFLHL